MCPGPGYIEKQIADEDDMEVDKCLTLAENKILGVVTASTQVPSVRFFMDEEEEYLQDSTTTATTDTEEIAFESHSDYPRDGKLERRLEAFNFLADNVNALRSEEEQPQYLKKLTIVTEQPSSTNDLEYYAQVTDLNEPRSAGLLKSPNSPGEKKSVRFADTVGLELEQIKLYKKEKDNHSSEDYFESEYDLPLVYQTRQDIFFGAIHNRQFVKRCEQRNKKDVSKTTEAQIVCVELIKSNGTTIYGLIQVKNIAYEKQVYVRYTLDDWRTYAEMLCSFSFSKLTYNHDIFCFSICLPLDLPMGCCFEMCVRFSAGGQNFWDNNNGDNYKLDYCE